MKTLDIDAAIKRSNMMSRSRRESSRGSSSLNRNIGKIGELGREISELRRRQSMASSPEERQKLEDVIEAKTKKFNQLKKEGYA